MCRYKNVHQEKAGGRESSSEALGKNHRLPPSLAWPLAGRFCQLIWGFSVSELLHNQISKDTEHVWLSQSVRVQPSRWLIFFLSNILHFTSVGSFTG